MSEQSEAAKRAAARKAKILARGNSGLNKLAQTARGDEAQMLYGDDTPSSRPATPSSSSTAKPTATSSASNSGPSWAPPPPSRPTDGPSAGMTDEQRRMQEQLAAMFGGGPGGAGGMPGLGMGAGGDAPDIQQLLSSMFGGMPPGGQPGQNLLGDLDDPAGFGGGPGANPFAALGNMPGMEGLGGMPGMGGMGGMPGMPGFGGPVKRGKVEKYFPLVHFLSIVVLAVFAIVWWEPSLRATRYGRLGALDLSWADRWSGLAAGRGTLRVIKDDVLGGIELLPIFWAFTTLELILQTTRFFVLKSPPAPHSLISNFLPLMPPGLARPLVTGSRYLSLIFQTYKDGALLVFLIGLAISVAPYLAGSSVRI